jgi:deoxyribodipyrimidine photolyase
MKSTTAPRGESISSFVTSLYSRYAPSRPFRKTRQAFHQSTYAELHIPLHIFTHRPRKTLPEAIMQFLRSIDARYLYANMEYEVDELRRDISICKLSHGQGVKPSFVHDKCIIEPATVFTQQGNPYTVSFAVDLPCSYAHAL